MNNQPLNGIRVLDFTHAAAGPYTTMFLADLGAEVIKVEKPGRGDGSRYMGEPLFGERESDYYVSLNRNKKGVLVDLATRDGRDIALRLASTSDIVLQNFRPGVMARLGLGFDELQAIRPGLVYCSISAFGTTGPWRDRPANDIIMQSISGIMGITGEEGRGPVRVGAPVSDYSSGLFALAGVLVALYARDQYPNGQHIKVAMLDCSIALATNYIPAVAMRGRRIERYGQGHAQIVPYQAFVCSDGQYVMVGAFTTAFWKRLAKAVGREEWLEDDRYASNASRLANRESLLNELQEIFGRLPRDRWIEILTEADVPNSPVLELDEAIRSEQAIHNNVVVSTSRNGGDESAEAQVVKLPIESPQWPSPTYHMAPSMGRDTVEVLEGLGIDSQEIGRLISRGVVGVPE